MQRWTPTSWRSLKAHQQPSFDPAALADVLGRVRTLPPLVSAGEVDRLKELLGSAGRGERFILQGGDCAERLSDCNSESIIRKLKILLQMALVLTYGARRPVIPLGRVAGQFAKPRSSDTEVIDGAALPTYRGDNVNAVAATLEARTPDPSRLERGYFSAAATLNFIRALVDGGFADLRFPEHWALDFLPDRGVRDGYREIADRIRDAIDYLDSLGTLNSTVRSIDFFTSHEGLLLPYEEALTRAEGARFYNLGAHFLWIGDRTRQLDGAHVEYFRGLANPIGLKVGPGLPTDQLLRLIERLSPDGEAGRLTLITRFGAKAIAEQLPERLRAVKEAGLNVVWSCDPMHGNTRTTSEGLKTRDFEQILGELRAAFEVHAAEGTVLSGVHFELTGDDVTECVGGGQGIEASDLSRSYETGCDPRLNYAQSLEIAFLISRLLQARRPGSGQVKGT